MSQHDPVKLFISYSHKDEAFKNRFDIALKPLKRLGMIDLWQDGLLLAGEEFEKTILQEIDNAEVVCLLVSPHFLNSDYCFSKEMEIALQNRRQNGCYVVPILLSSTPLWQKFEIGKLNALPKDGKPVDTWSNADEAWLNVVTKINELVEHIQKNGKRPLIATTTTSENAGTPPAASKTVNRESSTAPSPFAPIRKKVQFGKIREAIAELLELTEEKYPSEHNTALMLSGRWFNLQEKINGGTISEANAEVEVNKISASVLNLVKNLEEQSR